jgi:hypothetical protein
MRAARKTPQSHQRNRSMTNMDEWETRKKGGDERKKS